MFRRTYHKPLDAIKLTIIFLNPAISWRSVGAQYLRRKLWKCQRHQCALLMLPMETEVSGKFTETRYKRVALPKIRYALWTFSTLLTDTFKRHRRICSSIWSPGYGCRGLWCGISKLLHCRGQEQRNWDCIQWIYWQMHAVSWWMLSLPNLHKKYCIKKYTKLAFH